MPTVARLYRFVRTYGYKHRLILAVLLDRRPPPARKLSRSERSCSVVFTVRPQGEAMSQSSAGNPPTSPSGLTLQRRALLRGAAASAGVVTLPMVLAACGEKKGGGTGGSASKTVTVGSNASDAVPKKAYAEAYKAYETQSGKTVTVNTVDHNTFQENINRYLQGSPGSPTRSRRRRLARTARCTSCLTTCTTGRSSTGRACGRRRATPRRRRGTSTRPWRPR